MALTTSNGNQTGGHLRALRKAADLSQEALARRADCSIASVKLFEGGYTPEHSDVLPRILRALNDTGQAGNLAGSRIADDGGDHDSG